MGRNFTQLYLHCVWATWDRLPLITPDIQPLIYRAIIAKCNELNCQIIAIGGIEDHVHILTRFPPNLAISDLIKNIKGNSAHFINHQFKRDEVFKWQGSYGAFTVEKDRVESLKDYIKNQAIHHQRKTLIPLWEMVDTKQQKPEDDNFCLDF